MLIVTGLPYSGTDTLVSALKHGGLSTITWGKLANKTTNKQEIANIVNELIKQNEIDCIELPSFFLKGIEGQCKIIFIERDIIKCFNIIREKMKKEPDENMFKLHLKNVKRHFKEENKNVIFLKYNNIFQNAELELNEIKNLIPNFKKTTKMIKLMYQ
jgi:hypothetical protein